MDKKAVIVGVMLLFLVSCSSNEKVEEKPPSAGAVINNYIDTAITAKSKAEEARNAVEKRQTEEEQTINEMDK